MSNIRGNRSLRTEFSGEWRHNFLTWSVTTVFLTSSWRAVKQKKIKLYLNDNERAHNAAVVKARIPMRISVYHLAFTSSLRHMVIIHTQKFSSPYLKEQISRLIHPEVIGRVAGLGELYREATLQDQLAALPPRAATAHALHGWRHALQGKTNG